MAVPDRGSIASVVRRNWRRGLVAVLVVLVAAVGGTVAYFATPHHGLDWSVAAVEADEAVRVERTGGRYVLSPPDPPADRAGLVFYPGARVHPDAYLHTLAPLVREAGLTVVVTHPPLNLAVLDADAADGVIDRRPGVDRWYVGGHSLGGAMACRYAHDDPERVAGLVLLAARCDRDFRGRDLAVVSVTGGEDAVLNREAYRRFVDRLPADATVVEIGGMNHSQFGTYTDQPDDNRSTLTYEQAHARLANVTVPWFRTVAAESAG